MASPDTFSLTYKTAFRNLDPGENRFVSIRYRPKLDETFGIENERRMPLEQSLNIGFAQDGCHCNKNAS